MAFIVDEVTGNITLVQGDTGEYIITGLPTDQDYTAYLGVYNENRVQIGDQIEVPCNRENNITMFFPANLTDKFVVKSSEDTAEYYFGVKLCTENGTEDTLLLGENSQIGDLNTITVYPKKVEGLTNG